MKDEEKLILKLKKNVGDMYYLNEKLASLDKKIEDLSKTHRVEIPEIIKEANKKVKKPLIAIGGIAGARRDPTGTFGRI